MGSLTTRLICLLNHMNTTRNNRLKNSLNCKNKEPNLKNKRWVDKLLRRVTLLLKRLTVQLLRRVSKGVIEPFNQPNLKIDLKPVEVARFPLINKKVLKRKILPLALLSSKKRCSLLETIS